MVVSHFLQSLFLTAKSIREASASVAEDWNGRDGLWPATGAISASDADILVDMINRLKLGEVDLLTADSIYTAFLEVKKAADAWVKYYMISVVLLLMTAAGATHELTLFGTKVAPLFIGPAAILSFSVCTLAYTNHELKMRLYRAFFEGRLAAMDGPDRAQILLRYPLAFYGGSFLPHEARPKGFMLGRSEILASLPLLGVIGMGWLLAVFGLMLLVLYVLHTVYVEPQLPLLVKGAVFAFFVGSMIVSAKMLRNAKAKRRYET
jgi:hypothetical protein